MSFTSRALAVTRDDWRDVSLVAGARAVSLAGDFLAATALVLAFQQRGDSGYGVAALLLASTVPIVLLGPLGGRLADRFDSRRLLTVVGLAQALVCAAMAMTDHQVALIALAAALAAGVAISQPTFAALVPDMVGRDSLPRAMAIVQTASSVGMIGGPALAGFLVQGFGLRIPLLVNAATYLAIVGAGLMIRMRRGSAPPAAGTTADKTAAWSLRRDALLARLVPASAISIGAISVVNVVLVFFIRETLGASAAAYGLVDAVITVGLVIGAWLVAKKALGDSGLAVAMLVTLAGMSTMFLLASTVPTVAWLIPIYLVSGVFNGAMSTVANLLIARRVPPRDRGRAYGTWVSAANGAVAVGYLISGPLLQVLTPRQCVAAAGVTGLLAIAALGVPILRAARTDRRRPANEPQPADEPQETRLASTGA
jgi:MFS family permease